LVSPHHHTGKDDDDDDDDDDNKYVLKKKYKRVHPNVSGLAAWSENCKWYSSVPLDAIVSLFCESV
jgi:hypothetical protein